MSANDRANLGCAGIFFVNLGINRPFGETKIPQFSTLCTCFSPQSTSQDFIYKGLARKHRFLQAFVWEGFVSRAHPQDAVPIEHARGADPAHGEPFVVGFPLCFLSYKLLQQLHISIRTAFSVRLHLSVACTKFARDPFKTRAPGSIAFCKPSPERGRWIGVSRDG